MQPLLTIQELSRVLNIKTSTLYRYSAENKIPTLRVGVLLRFKLADIIKIMEGNGNGDHSTADENE